MRGKLLRGIESMYVDGSACVIVKGGEREWFRIDSGMRQGCIMSSWLFNVYMDGIVKEVKMRMERRRVSFMEDGKEWRLAGLFYADDLILCGMVGKFGEVCRRRGLKVNAG